MTNRLAREMSPYLLQHAENPVDWYAWSPEAFEKATKENKPIFLSIGYATCHWCHVMAHESFEDGEVAEVLNRDWVAIKVDREERPDLDQIYMTACQVLTGQGGWPLSVFMTPEGKPFYAGTYFPKNSRYGRPGFMDLLGQLHEKWTTHQDVVGKAADQLTQALKGQGDPAATDGALDSELLQVGADQLVQRFDRRWGGFGNAPKFPTPHYLNYLLRWYHRKKNPAALKAVEETLRFMRWGGIFDHIGLGFHRYSVDEKWLVPHFEKMLYDQALLAMAYLEAYQVTRKEEYAQTAREIFTYVLRDMTSPEGSFYAAEDADSEGVEGKFYVWRPEEVMEVLGSENGRLFCEFFDITPEGNFEDGLSIPHVHETLQRYADRVHMDIEDLRGRLEEAREKLFNHRENRVHPLKDDKILTAWNGLMVAALAMGARVLGEPEYARAAGTAVDAVLKHLRDDRGRLLRRYRLGQADFSAYLEDYAFLVWGLIELYESTFQLGYLEEATGLTRIMLDLFRDEDSGGLYFTGKDNEVLIARKKEVYDGAVPSGNSVAALNLLRLARFTGNTEFDESASGLLRAFAGDAARYPLAHTHFLMAVDFMLGPTREIVVVEGDDPSGAEIMMKALEQRFLPNKVLLLKEDDASGERLAALAPFTKEMKPVDGKTTVYLCENFACRQPITDPGELEAVLT